MLFAARTILPMTSRDFCYWLQGLFEVGNPKALDERQTEMVKSHLALVFVHEIDPSAGDAAHQAKLNKLHAASKKKPKPPTGGGPIGGTGPNGIVYRC